MAFLLKKGDGCFGGENVPVLNFVRKVNRSYIKEINNHTGEGEHSGGTN